MFVCVCVYVFIFILTRGDAFSGQQVVLTFSQSDKKPPVKTNTPPTSYPSYFLLCSAGHGPMAMESDKMDCLAQR